jgi:hypothetical protein
MTFGDTISQQTSKTSSKPIEQYFLQPPIPQNLDHLEKMRLEHVSDF